MAIQYLPCQIYKRAQKPTGSGREGGKGLKPRNNIEPNRDNLMVMRPFHPILKDATKYIREAG